jgi:hypothetical protein
MFYKAIPFFDLDFSPVDSISGVRKPELFTGTYQGRKKGKKEGKEAGEN